MILIISLIFASFSHASPVVSAHGLEGVLTFRTTVFKPANFRGPMVQLVNEHTKHLLGVLEQPQFSKINNLPSNDNLGSVAIGSLIGFRILNTINDLDGSGQEITYVVKHRVLVRKDVMAPNSSRSIQMLLPHSPLEFYSAACTDEEYSQKQYLFYYWNPYSRACREKQVGKNKVDLVEGEIKTLPVYETLVKASPDYSSLRRQIKARGELKIALLFGLDLTSKDPNDNGRKSYVAFQKYFEENGFETDRQRNTPTAPFTEYYRPASKDRFAVRVSLSLSASDVSNPIVFARRAREAFETADIVDYVGHSGLGGNLDLAQITRLSSPDPSKPRPIRFPNFYQIYFLDSCASFYFYVSEYRNVWEGAHHVDLVTDGTASFFYTQNFGTLNFLKAFIDSNQPTPWVDILESLERSHPKFSYLLSVSAIR